MIRMPEKLIDAELTPPSMLIGREVSAIQRPMAVIDHWLEVVDAPDLLLLFLWIKCCQYEVFAAT